MPSVSAPTTQPCSDAMLASRARVEYAESGVPLVLVSPPTKDLFTAIMEEGDPVERAQAVRAALSGGADPEPWNGVVAHGAALAAIASVSSRSESREFRDQFRPLVTTLLKSASARAKQSALTIALRTPPTKWLVNDLRRAGVELGGSDCLKSIYFSCADDAKILAQLRAARATGWKPCGDAIEGTLLCSMIKSRQAKAMVEFVEAYVQADVTLPAHSGDGGTSPMRLAFEQMGRASSKNVDAALTVVHALATCGHFPASDDTSPNRDWLASLADYRKSDPSFLPDFEAWMIEGEHARIHRHTPAAPAKKRAGPRL